MHHVDTSAQVRQLTEAEEPETEYPQKQQQEPEQEPYEVADQDPEQDLTNSANPQGKHRFILTHNTSQVLYFMICWSVHLSS